MNSEHLAILKTGKVENWNRWRKENPEITPDLSGSNLQGEFLQGANLQEAFLQGAILRGADFLGAKFKNTTYGEGVLISKEPIQITGFTWFILIFDEHMKIGCEFHSFDEWENFTDERIDKMHREALTFWKGNKKRLLDICKNR